MTIDFQTRDLSPDERRALHSLRTKAEKAGYGWIRPWHYIPAAMLGAGCAWLAFHTGSGFLRFLFGTIAVLAIGFVVFTPLELLKMRKKHRDLLRRLTAFIERGTVGMCPVSATRIALAREYDDEGDLYIVELAHGRVLYIEDLNYNMKDKFPCLRFEVYDDEFFGLTGKRLLPLSGKVPPAAVIAPEKKRAYWTQLGAPGDLVIEDVDFHELIERYNSLVS
jgi:hypothetical protein